MRRASRGWRNLVLSATLLVTSSTGCSTPEKSRSATSLIGVDGADWRNVLPLVRQGKLPVITALRRAGSSAVMLTNADYRWSPVLWTTIATGKLPEEHGIVSFMVPVPGLARKVPTPSTERRCRAIWNIFSERGRTVGFVGWWATWPAEPVNGFLVTDHFSVSRFDLDRDYEKGVKDPRFFAGQTYPEDLLEDIAKFKVPIRSVNRADLAKFASLPENFEFPERFRKFEKVSEFAIAHSVDRTHFGAGRELLASIRPELFGIFFEGVDIMQHYLWEHMDPEATETTPSLEDRRTYGESIERYYRWVDTAVGSLIEAGGDERAVMLVSDHGFRPSTERYAEKNISGEHRRQSFFLFSGPGVRRGQLLKRVDAVDITPTVLAYHDLPVAADMRGDALWDCLDPAWRDRAPEPIETYETREWVRGELPESSVSTELRARIEALGYLDE